jgi:hypothetical protein
VPFEDESGPQDFDVKTVSAVLATLGLKANAPMSVLVVEMTPQDVEPDDPLGPNLGRQRILRSSNPVALPHIC